MVLVYIATYRLVKANLEDYLKSSFPKTVISVDVGIILPRMCRRLAADSEVAG